MANEGDWQVVTHQRRRAKARTDATEDNVPPGNTTTKGFSYDPRMRNPSKGPNPKARKSAKATLPAEPTPASVEPIIHEFPVPHPNDHILSKARGLVSLHNRSTFARFTDPLRLYALACTPTTFTNHEFNTVDVALVYRQDGKRLSMKLVRNGKGSQRQDALLCKYKGDWTSFGDWLAALKAPAGKEMTGEQGYEKMRVWWDQNGKSFRLMKLPAELRITVLKALIGPVLYPCSRYGIGGFGEGSDDPRYLSSTATSINIDHTKPRVPRPNLDFIMQSRLLYEYVKPHLLYDTVKAFEDYSALARYRDLLQDHGPHGLEYLRHLKLDFTQKQYILFFGVNVAPFASDHVGLDPFGCHGEATMLQNLPHLKSLTLNFRSTIGMAEDSAWGWTGHYNGHFD